jgi:DNA-binding protein HU-beta
MTKTQLIEHMSKYTGISKAEAGKALASLLDSIKQALGETDGRIRLPGFGTFSKVHRKARQGVNPSTGEKITIEARDAIRFKLGKVLKDAVL